MSTLNIPTTEISKTGQSIEISSLSCDDLFDQGDAEYFFLILFNTFFLDKNITDNESDKQCDAYLKYSENNFSEAYRQGLEAGVKVIQNRNADSHTLFNVIDFFPNQLEMAKAVAQHPNCSNELLAKMLHWLPDAANQNPKLDTPDYQTEHWMEQVKKAKPWNAKPKYIEEDQLELFKVLYYLEKGTDSDRAYIFSLKGTPEKLTHDFLKSRNANIRKTLAQRDSLTEDGFTILAGDKAKTIRLAVANNPSATPEALALLCEDKLQEIIKAAMANPACPEQALNQTKLKQSQLPTLGEQGIDKLTVEDIRQLLFDSKTASTTLDSLINHQEAWIRYACGIHPNASVTSLEKLATDDEPWVRESFAFNHNTPHSILEKLEQSNEISTKIALASNPATPESVQLKLAAFGNNKLLLALLNQTEFESVWHKVLETCKTKKDRKLKWQEYLTKSLSSKTKAGPLRTLSRGTNSRHLFVQRIIARHPNCPPSLKGLFAQYLHSDLMRNPSIALQLLENPQAIAPETCAEWIIKEWGNNANMPGHVSRFFLQGDDPKLARIAIDSWTSLLRDQQRWVLTSDIHVRKRIANKCEQNRFMYEALAHDPKESIRELIAKKKVRFASTKKQLSKDKSTVVRAALAQNKSAKTDNKKNEAPLEVANKGPKRQRLKLAKEATDIQILEQFVDDRDAEVRVAVACNKYATEASLTQLAQEQNETLLLAIADHDNTAPEILIILSKHSSEKVRQTVARHKKLPDQIIRELLDDPIATVRVRALRQFEQYKNGKDKFSDFGVLSKMSQDSDKAIRKIVAKYTQNIAIQQQYSKDEDIYVRRALASNPQLEESVAMVLSKDSNKNVLEELACHCKHMKILIALTHRSDTEIFYYIGCNFSLRKQQLISFAEELIKMGHEGALLSAISIYFILEIQPELNILLDLASHKNPIIRQKLFDIHKNPKVLPSKVIDRLLENPSEQFVLDSMYDLSDTRILKLIERGHIKINALLAMYTEKKVILLRLAEENDDSIRESLANNGCCDDDILDKLNAVNA